MPDYRRLHTIVSTPNLQNLSYTYDNAGNITQIVNSLAAETLNYAYDPANRLHTGYGVDSLRAMSIRARHEY